MPQAACDDVRFPPPTTERPPPAAEHGRAGPSKPSQPEPSLARAHLVSLCKGRRAEHVRNDCLPRCGRRITNHTDNIICLDTIDPPKQDRARITNRASHSTHPPFTRQPQVSHTRLFSSVQSVPVHHSSSYLRFPPPHPDHVLTRSSLWTPHPTTHNGSRFEGSSPARQCGRITVLKSLCAPASCASCCFAFELSLYTRECFVRGFT